MLEGKDGMGGNMFSWVCLHAANAEQKQIAPCCASCSKEELKHRSASAEIAGAALQSTTQQHEALSGGMPAVRIIPCNSCTSHGTHNAISTQPIPEHTHQGSRSTVGKFKAHQEEGDNDCCQNADSRNEVGVHAQRCGVGVRPQQACPAGGAYT